MSKEGAELVICDGGLASLIACTMAARRAELRPDPATIIAWFVPRGDQTDGPRRGAARAASAILSIAIGEGPAPAGNSAGERETNTLLHASGEAIRNGVKAITWSVQIGGTSADDWPEIEAISSRMDRALLCARLASIDTSDVSNVGVQIETPLIDLTDRQLAELAADLGVAIETCWWWETGADGTGPAGSEYRHWKPLLESAGLACQPA